MIKINTNALISLILLVIIGPLIVMTIDEWKYAKWQPKSEFAEMVPIPRSFRDMGYDSVQVFSLQGKTGINFCYPNGLRFKKDTVYTGDTAYKVWDAGFMVTKNWWMMAKKGHNSFNMENGSFSPDHLDSVTLDKTYRLKITLLKPDTGLFLLGPPAAEFWKKHHKKKKRHNHPLRLINYGSLYRSFDYQGGVLDAIPMDSAVVRGNTMLYPWRLEHTDTTGIQHRIDSLLHNIDSMSTRFWKQDSAKRFKIDTRQG